LPFRSRKKSEIIIEDAGRDLPVSLIIIDYNYVDFFPTIPVPYISFRGGGGPTRINADSRFFNLFADTFLINFPESFLGTDGINLTSFLHSFASNITTNLAKTISGTTGTRLSFVAPVLKRRGSKV